MKYLPCQQCGGVMKRVKKSEGGSCLYICIALLFVALGVFLCFTVIGAFVGVPMIIGALFIGPKKHKKWVCTTCGTMIDRA